MTRKKTYGPGRGYKKQDWVEVSDNPEWSTADVRAAKPFAKAFPDLAEAVTLEIANLWQRHASLSVLQFNSGADATTYSALDFLPLTKRVIARHQRI